MNTPLVSVIIPCYNQGKFIEDTVESVLNQTYANTEIIIVNDGSTDAITNNILTNAKWDKAKIIFKENTGVSDTRNIGIQESKGKYILPLDGDDLLEPSYIEKATAILEENTDITVVTTDVVFFGKKHGEFVLPEYSLEALLGQNLIVCTSMFRRTDFDNSGGFNINMKEGFEDWDFWLALLKRGGKVYRIREKLFKYRISKKSRNGSLSIETQARLRKQIYLNHIDLYSTHFFNPQLSFEYLNVVNSKEYRLGKFLLAPMRKFLGALLGY